MIYKTQTYTSKHPDRSEDIWWSNETLCFCDAESHALLENDWQKVGDGVGDRRRQHEQRSKAPDLKVGCAIHVVLKAERHGDGIVTVAFDSRHNELGLLLVQEWDGNAFGLLMGCFLGLYKSQQVISEWLSVK
jgi:hypothetical protein